MFHQLLVFYIFCKYIYKYIYISICIGQRISNYRGLFSSFCSSLGSCTKTQGVLSMLESLMHSIALPICMYIYISGHKWSTTRRVLKSHRRKIGVRKSSNDCIHSTSILLLWNLSTLCVMDHLWPLTLRSLLSLLSTL